MKMLCCDDDIAVCNELKEILESHGIGCCIKNESPQPVLGGEDSPLTPSMPQIWIKDDSDIERALHLIHREHDFESSE